MHNPYRDDRGRYASEAVDGNVAISPRFWSKVDKNGPVYKDRGPCWLWTANIDRYGYARFNRSDKAHRFAYERLIGPIPAGLEPDHLCATRRCVNPAHLELVTHAENVRRSDMHWNNGNAAKTHCKQGHPYDDANTYRTGARRECRECKRLWDRAYKATTRAGRRTQQSLV